jgi:hypothetical protein
MRHDHVALIGRKRQLLCIGGSKHILTADGANREAVPTHDSGNSDVNVFVEIKPGKQSIRLHVHRSS